MIILKGNEFKKLLPKRTDISHKGTFGTLAIVGGSHSYQGAPYFATHAALRTGVGIAVAFIPEQITSAFCSKISGAVVEPLATANGCICDNTVIDKIKNRRVSAVVVGCGLGLSNNLNKTVSDVLSLDLPTVIDGDAISAVATDKNLLCRNAPTVLTPHTGELSRLLGLSIDKIVKDRYNLVANFSVKNNCFTVSKDSETVISDPKGRLFVLNKPCSALSKGGSGDVLAGMTGSFIAQGMDIKDSVISAVTLHNWCGIAASKKYGARYSQPDDYINMIQKGIK